MLVQVRICLHKPEKSHAGWGDAPVLLPISESLRLPPALYTCDGTVHMVAALAVAMPDSCGRSWGWGPGAFQSSVAGSHVSQDPVHLEGGGTLPRSTALGTWEGPWGLTPWLAAQI